MANVLGVTPTKGSLMAIQKSLSLSTLGFELLDRKRNILIREMMLLIDKVKSLRGEISSTYREAYEALQEANVTLGMVQETAMAVPVDDGVTITYRSVMGVEIPNVRLAESEIRMCYGLDRTNSRLDYAYVCFQKAKRVTALLAEVENSVYRLANAIRKTQRRANALGKHRDPALRGDGEVHHGRARGKGPRGVFTTQGHQGQKTAGGIKTPSAACPAEGAFFGESGFYRPAGIGKRRAVW